MILTVFLLAFVLLTTFLYFEWKQNYKVSFSFKAMSSFAFIALIGFTYFYAISNPGLLSVEQSDLNFYFAFVLIGLGFGFVGDVVLATRTFHDASEYPFLVNFGTIVFGLGHIMYLIALSRFIELNVYAILFTAVVTFLIFFIGFKMNLQFGKMLLTSIIYSVLLFLFVGQTIFEYASLPNNSFALILLIASILFALSDLILSQIYYNNMETKMMKTVNLILYYGAQYLIAFSLFFMVVI